MLIYTHLRLFSEILNILDILTEGISMTVYIIFVSQIYRFLLLNFVLE